MLLSRFTCGERKYLYGSRRHLSKAGRFFVISARITPAGHCPLSSYVAVVIRLSPTRPNLKPASDGGAFPCVGELAPPRSRGAAGLVTASRRGSDGAGGDRRASGRRTSRRGRPSWVRRRREPRSRDWRASNCLLSRRHFRTGGYFSKPRIYAPKRGRCSRIMLELVGAISAIFSGPFAACRHAEVSAVSAALCSPLYKITSSLG